MEASAMTGDFPPPPANHAKPASGLAPLAGLAEQLPAAQRDAQGRFLTGNNGGGRTKGARNKLSEVFLSAVTADFAEHGAQALADLRTKDPESYLRLVGALVPREHIVEWERQPDIDYAELSFEDAAKLVDAERKRKIIRKAIEG
jgi:hypothetical protein